MEVSDNLLRFEGMRLIIVNKKRLGVTIIIVGLMITMFGIQSIFKDSIKLTSLMQSNIHSLKEYSALNGKVTYKLPYDWISEKRDFGGEEIIYHNDFQAKDFKVYGFVEVWNLNQDLKTFIERSKDISVKQNIIEGYKLSNVKINDKDAYYIEYSLINSQNIKYKAFEYFIPDNNKFIRFSFFTREDNFKENMPTIFKAIVETLKIS